MLASQIIRGLPESLDGLGLFDLSTLRQLVGDEAVRGASCRKAWISTITAHHPDESGEVGGGPGGVEVERSHKGNGLFRR